MSLYNIEEYRVDDEDGDDGQDNGFAAVCVNGDKPKSGSPATARALGVPVEEIVV